MSESLGEREMLWEQVSVSSAFSSSPKLSLVFLYLDRNVAYMVSISLRKHCDDINYQNVNSLCSCHHYINSDDASSVSPSSYTNTIFNQS